MATQTAQEGMFKDMMSMLTEFPQIDSTWGEGINLKLKGQRNIRTSGVIGITTDTNIVYAFHYPNVNKIVVKCEGWVFQPLDDEEDIQNTAVLES